MRISVVTPTGDRPFGIALAEKYMARQTIKPYEWIVADGGKDPARCTMGQTHLHEPSPSGAANLAKNVIRAMDAASGDAIVMWEDDDAYAPDHLEKCIEGLARQSVYGSRTLKYFNVVERCWAKFPNNGAALCQTAFRRSEIPRMREAAEQALAAGDYKIDGRFWRGLTHLANGSTTVVGIKGLPGQRGLGTGHRPSERRGLWKSDPKMEKLREWIGEYAANYANL